MISGIDLSATIDFKLVNDTDNPTVWKLGMLPSDLLAHLGTMTKDGKIDQVEAAFFVVAVGVKGWENFTIPYAIEDVKLPGLRRAIKGLSQDTLAQIPLNVFSELAQKTF